MVRHDLGGEIGQGKAVVVWEALSGEVEQGRFSSVAVGLSCLGLARYDVVC